MANKRPTLTQIGRLAAVAADAATLTPPESVVASTAKKRTVRDTTTALHIAHADLALLRRVAVERANGAAGGRPSVSAVVEWLIDQHRAELEAEANGGRT